MATLYNGYKHFRYGRGQVVGHCCRWRLSQSMAGIALVAVIDAVQYLNGRFISFVWQRRARSYDLSRNLVGHYTFALAA